MKTTVFAISALFCLVLLAYSVNPARPGDALEDNLVLGRARVKAGTDCGCGGTGSCTVCGDTCLCRPAGMKANPPARSTGASPTSLVLGKARMKINVCGCSGPDECVCGAHCGCPNCGVKSLKADDGGPDWSWDGKGRYWYRVRAKEPPTATYPALNVFQPLAPAYFTPATQAPISLPALYPLHPRPFFGGFSGGFTRGGGRSC
jgi:hypothetical protein